MRNYQESDERREEIKSSIEETVEKTRQEVQDNVNRVRQETRTRFEDAKNKVRDEFERAKRKYSAKENSHYILPQTTSESPIDFSLVTHIKRDEVSTPRGNKIMYVLHLEDPSKGYKGYIPVWQDTPDYKQIEEYLLKYHNSHKGGQRADCSI